MKIYKIYKKIPKKALDHIEDLSMESKYPLYAHTVYKKMLKAFTETRNMNKYTLITSDIDKADYVNFHNKYANTLISNYPYMHYVNGNPTSVDVITTWGEKESVTDFIDSGMLFDQFQILSNVNIFKLKLKYIDILFKSGFLDYWKISVDKSLLERCYNEINTSKLDDYLGDPMIYTITYYDELNVLFYLYSDHF